jgi:hypothetical protein
MWVSMGVPVPWARGVGGVCKNIPKKLQNFKVLNEIIALRKLIKKK